MTYSSEVNEVLIPYTTREDTYNYYEVRNYVNDVNQENTQVLQTYDDEMKARETYTYGNERLSYTNEQTKDEYQYLTDARGSVTGMMKDGELDSSNSYSVFGTPEEIDETGNPYGYTGEAQDVTGYNYLRARYYDSQSGTFLTQDSYEGEEDNPLSQNGYTYVENNPINYSDPTGHKKNFFQNLWSGVKKTVNKYVVKPVVKYANKAKNWIVNKVNSAFNTVSRVAGNLWSSAKSFVSNVYSGASKFFSSGSSGRTTYGPPYYGSGVNMIAVGAPNSYNNMTHAQRMAVLTSQRQQRLNLEYQQVTGSKGKPKTKEGANLLKNWGKSVKETWTKFCKTAPKAKKVKHQSAGVVALSPEATWGLPAGGKVIGKTTVKMLGKIVWVYTVLDLTNKAVNYIEHGDTNDMEVGGDITPKDVANGKIKGLLGKAKSGEKTNGPTTQYDKKGNYSDAEKDFDNLGLKDVKEIDTKFGKGKVGTLDDGRKVVIRPGSTLKNGEIGEHGPPTLEIQDKVGPGKTKIRYK